SVSRTTAAPPFARPTTALRRLLLPRVGPGARTLARHRLARRQAASRPALPAAPVPAVLWQLRAPDRPAPLPASDWAPRPLPAAPPAAASAPRPPPSAVPHRAPDRASPCPSTACRRGR